MRDSDDTYAWEHNEQRLDDETSDLIWQEFMDWAHNASIPVVLHHVARLMNGQTDPYHINIDQRLMAYVDLCGWSSVLLSLSQIQREREKRAA